MNRIVVVIIFSLTFFGIKAQTILNSGDLAMLGVNTTITPSTQDEISFVCFKDITNGTTIQLTDNGYEACAANQWSSAEGGATLTRTGGTITAGTVMTFRDSYGSGNPIRFTSPDANWITTDLIANTVKASYIDMNSKGDQLYMSQNGTWTMQPNTPCTVSSSAGGSYTTEEGVFPGADGRILYGFSTSGGWNALQFSTGESGLYPNTDCFTTAISGNSEYNKYTGLLSKATQTEWLSRIGASSNWTSYATSKAYFAASPDFSSLSLSIDPNGAVPTPTWASNKSLLCSDAGNIDFSGLVTGTKSGTWSGTGVSSNGVFNPSGLNGYYDITYTVNYTSGNKTCTVAHTDTINVATGVTPTFTNITQLMQNSIPPILPTTSNNTPAITGTWNAPISTKTKGITTYTFTPTIGICNHITTMDVDVIDSALSTPTTCLGSTLYLTGVSGAKKITWYKDGVIDTTINQTRATVAVTVAGGNGQGAGNNQFYRPWGVAVDNNRNVYVSDYYNHRIMEWGKGAKTGTLFAGVTGVHAQTPNHFYNPTGLYLSPTGSLYISDWGNHKIQKYLAGSTTSTIVGGNSSSGNGLSNLANPYGLMADADSNLFVADAGNYPPGFPFLYNPSLGNRIMKWVPNATAGTLVAGNAAGAGTGLGYLSYPSGVYVNKAGDIYIADFANFRIIKWLKNATTGVVVADLSKLGTGNKGVNPTDVWVDETTDSLYITASNDIVDFAAYGLYNGSDNLLYSWKEGDTKGTVINTGNASGNKLLSPLYLTVSNDGSIYVSDAGNNRVQAWLTSIDTTLTPTKAGSYYAVINGFDGTTDTSNTIIISQPTTSTTKTSICAGSSFTFNGTSYSAAGTYTVKLKNSGGCDSTATLILSIKPSSSSTTNLTVCPKQLPYTWNGLIFNSAGTQTAHLFNSAGCDSAATLVLTVNNSVTSTTNLTICPNQLPYTWNGLTFNSAGTQTAKLTNSLGCDSAATLVLTVNNNLASTTKDSICPSQFPYTWNGLTFTSAGTQTANLKNAAGCDSAATLILSLKTPTTSTSNLSICPSLLPYSWNGLTFNAAGTQTATLTGSSGCDSLATLILTLKTPSSSTTKLSICPNQLPYLWNGITFNAAGTQTATLANSVGCDSLATLILTINNTVTSTTYDSICPNQLPFVWNGLTFNGAGSQTANLVSSTGCDSAATLILFVKATSSSTTYDTICQGNSYTFNGVSYNTAGTYTAHLTNSVGCDSAATLVLTVSTFTSSTSDVSICAGGSIVFNGTSYDSAGTYSTHLTTSLGCDSTARLVLKVKYPSSSTTNASICSGNTYTFNGKTYAAAGTYTIHLINSVGCDSAATLILTINPSTTSSTNAAICSGASYAFNGTNYSTAGTYTVHLNNAAGCDSAATLVLTVHTPSSSNTPVSICQGSSYSFNGVNYNTSGTYTTHLLNSNGCDSVATLTLVVNNALSSNTRASICKGSSYTFNGTTYNTSGTYTTHIKNSLGCDSAATLTLTVNDSTSSKNYDTICLGGSFTFNGIAYTTAGTYTSHLTNSVGCDSAATLFLAVDSGHILYPPEGSTVICKNNSITLTDLISGGTWSSLYNNIATVDNNGLVTGVNYGIDTIKYTVLFPCGVATSSLGIQVLGIKPISTPSINNATCLHPQGGSIKVAVTGSEGPYKISYNGAMYDTAYTISNLPAGSYDVPIYNNADCPVDTLKNILITVVDDGTCDTLFVPSAFVPNSANTNVSTKVLKPFAGSSVIQSVTFKVFNRFGSVVFESHDINSGWDGRINGTLQDTGTYIWYLDYKQANGIMRHSKGISVLIR